MSLPCSHTNELCSCYSKSFFFVAAKQTRATIIRLKRHMKEKKRSRNAAIWQNFRAKLLRRRRDRDQSVAKHPESVNAALSASTSPSLPSLSLTSCTAQSINAVMENISLLFKS